MRGPMAAASSPGSNDQSGAWRRTRRGTAPAMDGAGGVGVVRRFEHHHLVARLAERQERGGDGLGGAGGHQHLVLGGEFEAVPGRLVRRDGGPQLGHALTRGVLVAPGCDGRGRHLRQLGRTVGVGKSLTEVEGSGGYGQLGHFREDRRREGPQPLGEDVRGAARHAHDGTGGLSSGRTVLTVANFNMHAGVDGWGRPFDPIAACAAFDADVLVLEESWTNDADGPGSGQAERIAAALGYHVRDVPPRRGPAGPAPPRRHRLAGCPAWAFGPRSGRSTYRACAPSLRASWRRPATAAPNRGHGGSPSSRGSPGATWWWRDRGYSICPRCGGTGCAGRPSWWT